ncbi:fructose-bisphosphate aldolase [Sulfolobus acidocaldarius]|uniref:Conserved protein n=5 Tax=Sulfolobus acidocaldarius TaxID=2285 RepID=Q4J6M1_SULAC|nr:conserved protein [Sulfolobus acidocaldarius DSM 639]AGE72163.1 hypothetical protein SacN8_11085 [Sulfolobus acidocaldarius N8]AGE74480.1 hypothetical protein SacRon12I_11330 [Sulfolobus acidocaldarius Ron12/I]ALU29665.1 fructose-bisphosphate aldolase [Sulfolobus acidocaldarius]ALU32400.1 fructose-bisphosphate aldolase [Sulfolobus acidocaldarius]
MSLGDRLSLLFENRDTVAHQIQEMIYLDKLYKKEDILREIQVYSTLLPCNGKLKATLYIHAYDFKDLDWVFDNLGGIYNEVYLKVGSKLIQGEPEGGREQGREFSTVQYLIFDLQGEKSTDMELQVLHKNYKYTVKLDKKLAEDLIKDAYEVCEQVIG